MEPVHLDEECWKIVRALSEAPKTPQMLARMYGMPIADTWMRIRFLEGLGVIYVVLSFSSRDGRILHFYQCGEPPSVVLDKAPVAYFEPIG